MRSFCYEETSRDPVPRTSHDYVKNNYEFALQRDTTFNNKYIPTSNGF